ncbi:MAG: hypothetical protein HYR62_03765 [Actinobacteria bacterium]|nr:hypothetical protein [Actinomycetota bacterium]
MAGGHDPPVHHRPGRRVHRANQAERNIRPVKVEQRTSGGIWRTLNGLATVQSHLYTTTRWGIHQLDARTQLFATGPWPPPATAQPQLRPHTEENL